MKTDDAIAKLDDNVLWAQTHRAARAEQGALVELLRFLGEVDARKLYLERGFGSLWAFMLSLHFSESQCAARITAAKVLRRYPWVAHDLEAGRLHLTAVAMVGGRVLKHGDVDMLKGACGMNRTQLDALLAEPEPGKPLAPLSAARTRARIVPLAGRRPAVSPGSAVADTDARPPAAPAMKFGASLVTDQGVAENMAGAAPARPPAVVPTASRAMQGVAPSASPEPVREAVSEVIAAYRVTLTLTAEAHADLREAQSLMRHRQPNGDLNAVVATALRAFVREQRSRKFGLTRAEQDQVPQVGAASSADGDTDELPPAWSEASCRLADALVALATGLAEGPTAPLPLLAKVAAHDGLVAGECHHAIETQVSTPRQRPTMPGGVLGRGVRDIPRAVRRAVTLRDEARCSYRAQDGTVCGAGAQLEFDHIIPFALGGPHTVDNLRLRCRAHNGLAAERVFGRETHRGRVRAAQARRQQTLMLS